MADTKKKSELVLAREGKVGKISIIGDIGWDWFGISYQGFRQKLDALGDVSIIEVDITSRGGYVTDGVAMMNALIEHEALVHTYINGEAASIASVLAMAGDRIFMPDNSLMFLHKPLNIVFGNADEMRKMAVDLDKFENAITNAYQRHFKGSDEDVQALMKTETWLTADEVEDKFNNVTVLNSMGEQVAAHSDPLAIFGEIDNPDELKNSFVDRVVNAVRQRTGNKIQVKPNEEVDMTPEERIELVKEITSEVVNALQTAAKGEADKEAQDKADADAQANLDADAQAKEIPFEGDLEKLEDVQAHLEKIQLAQLKESADMTTPEGVVAYKKALAELQGETSSEALPGSNADVSTGVMGVGGTEPSQEAVNAAVDRMIKK